jgi:sirohydrochlorin ferrochelatase
MKAVLLISHGSRSAETKKEVMDLVGRLRQRRAADIVECAFLELEAPSIPEGIDLCVAQGAREVVVLLNFLNSGRHVDQDIPEIVRQAQVKHPTVKISVTRPVGQHPKIEDLFLDLLK